MSYKYSGTFSISAPATITITAPNSGTFYVGDTVNITWSTTGTVGNVKIELYNTANNLAGTITSSTSNDGSYSWTIAGSMIAQYETEYQLKIFQVSGSSPVDYSGNLTIYPYFARTATDNIGISQGTVGRSSTTWKYVKTATDNIGISQGTVDRDDRVWRNVRTAVDSIDIVQAVQKVITGHRSAIDNIGISQGTVGRLASTWRYSFVNTDNIGISQGTVSKVPRTWKNVLTNTDNVAISQGTVGKYYDKWKHIFDNTDNIDIAQSVISIMTGHREAIDNIGITQGTVGKLVSTWFNKFTNTDNIGIGDSAPRTPGVWRIITTLTTVDDIGIQQSVSYYKDAYYNAIPATSNIGMTQEFLYDVTSGDGIKLIYETTVIFLGNRSKLPVHEPIRPKQLMKFSGIGQVKVTDYADAEKFVNLNVNIDETTSSNVTNFFKNTVQFAKKQFYYQDEAGYRQRVRLWDASGFDIPVESGGQRNVSIQMRVE